MGKREPVDMFLIHLFVLYALNYVVLPLPLSAICWLRVLIVTVPGLKVSCIVLKHIGEANIAIIGSQMSAEFQLI